MAYLIVLAVFGLLAWRLHRKAKADDKLPWEDRRERLQKIREKNSSR